MTKIVRGENMHVHYLIMSLLLEIADIVLSSAKCYVSDFSEVETRSFRNILKRTRPKMESWCTPGSSV